MTGATAHAAEPLLLHNFAFSFERLLAQPSDLPGWVPWDRSDPPAPDAASAGASRLLAHYLAESADPLDRALSWWADLVATAASRAADSSEVLRDCYRLRPAGPASHPALVGLVRRHWLACDRLNRSRGDVGRVPPEVLLLVWPLALGQRLLCHVLAGMPYWPIGLDAERNWC